MDVNKQNIKPSIIPMVDATNHDNFKQPTTHDFKNKYTSHY